MKNKAIINNGDVFLIELDEKSYVIGQVVIGGNDVVLVALTNHRLTDWNISISFNKKDVIAILFVTTNHFEKKMWKIVDNRNVIIDFNTLEHTDASEIGAISYTSPMIQKFAKAYFGLQPWNGYADPEEFDKMLIKGVTRPKNVIFKE